MDIWNIYWKLGGSGEGGGQRRSGSVFSNLQTEEDDAYSSFPPFTTESFTLLVCMF